ncbi:MAG: hypothetical protein KAS66_10610 [Candidatus Omnitrophica bacterium]|nr:hypothetical protein [Candidatus Omnitrophota bacterium]
MGECNTKIDWNEFIEGHNRIHGTEFRSPHEMLSSLYNHFETLKGVAGRLGLSTETVGKYMRRWGLPRMSRGHRGNSRYQRVFRNLPNKDKLTQREMAEAVGCSPGYIPWLKKRWG